MTTIGVNVCDLSAGNKISRFPVQLIDLSLKTDVLFSEIASKFGPKENEFEVFYRGHKLEKDVNLQTVNFTPQSSVFVFMRPTITKESSSNSQRVGEKVLHIQRAVQSPNFRKTVDQLMTNSKSLNKLFTEVPGLDKAPIILSMLVDPELLQILAHQHNIRKICKTHPLFEAAAAYIANIVNEEQSRDSSRARGGNIYSLDQMSDEEDEGHQAGARMMRGAAGAGAAPQQITASQLAAALAAATQPRPSGSATSNPGPSTQGASASGSGTSVITPDFFQQAMMTAQSSALEAQLQQMRDMGITDERAARQALTATGGDLQAALEILYGDRSME